MFRCYDLSRLDRLRSTTRELDIIRKLRRRAASLQNSGLVAGIGEDCAIFRLRGAGEDLLLTTDLLLEGVHFLRATHAPDAIGHKALARGLSDIAAMGGKPRFCFVSLAVPRSAAGAWLDEFYTGLLRLARETKTTLAGGDLSRSRTIMCDIVVCGSAPAGRALRRNGAKPGDGIFVSGLLGGSAFGLRTRRGAAWKVHLRPDPRLQLGVYVRQHLRATAAMDLTDGLSLDMHRLCVESGVSAVIDGEVPTFPGATERDALHGGEDYELLFTLPKGVRAPAKRYGIPLTRIGTIKNGRPGALRFHGRSLEPRGYDHFRTE